MFFLSYLSAMLHDTFELPADLSVGSLVVFDRAMLMLEGQVIFKDVFWVVKADFEGSVKDGSRAVQVASSSGHEARQYSPGPRTEHKGAHLKLSVSLPS